MNEQPPSKDMKPGTRLRAGSDGSVVTLDCRKTPDDGRTRGIPFRPGWWLKDNRGGLADFVIDDPEMGWEILDEDVIHPWAATPDDEPHPVCELCWHSDGDARSLRCGRSVGGRWACECGDQQRIGPCVTTTTDAK